LNIDLRSAATIHHPDVENPWRQTVGLACGGEIEVIVEPVSPEAFPELGDALRTEHPAVVTATVIEHEKFSAPRLEALRWAEPEHPGTMPMSAR
jgi:xanthine/CO dehydrogenase XdhC/CoxF family maturation factor